MNHLNTKICKRVNNINNLKKYLHAFLTPLLNYNIRVDRTGKGGFSHVFCLVHTKKPENEHH